jgi:hypothetical protein
MNNFADFCICTSLCRIRRRSTNAWRPRPLLIIIQRVWIGASDLRCGEGQAVSSLEFGARGVGTRRTN